MSKFATDLGFKWEPDGVSYECLILSRISLKQVPVLIDNLMHPTYLFTSVFTIFPSDFSKLESSQIRRISIYWDSVDRFYYDKYWWTEGDSYRTMFL